ncbi:MAG: hypothetical protein ABIH11_00520 [Candidatus Altiarchaeota archaeon]
MKVILVVLVFSITLLSAVTNVSAMSSCSRDSFIDSCAKCSFNAAGKMDKYCYDTHVNLGRICVFTAYPGSALKWSWGSCPALQRCVDNLKACTNFRCPGADSDDCTDPFCQTCFDDSDKCAAIAAKDCDSVGKCGNQLCEKNKGETEETCCQDCGCPSGIQCKDNRCAVEDRTPCTANDMGIVCPRDFSKLQCAARGSLYFTKKSYKDVELKCCTEASDDDPSVRCYFNGELKTSVDRFIEGAEEDAVGACGPSTTALPLVLLSFFGFSELLASLNKKKK